MVILLFLLSLLLEKKESLKGFALAVFAKQILDGTFHWI